ncbi:VOC family protein [Frankia sp. CNm7]|uniref:VOC family protein n=1 Tax=Frankia nepalensis TaxID=1836974 RepID=A0A937RJH8_9ACTN|nr:VOC family protein [Frankia nepalensis]MBL7502271.1 VOC family protein [Frankia nepalensis]MBL7515872.1 VOC family protein [Frankia nepalensis]MBL7516548.1 VOC family protein [Frankia nepalensis]MBL7631392.1 VOC family protein [Frankia nepalensis]
MSQPATASVSSTPVVRASVDLVGLVVADMAASLAFYRLLGLDLPADADGQPHVEVTLPGGLRLAWDTTDTIRSFDPGWTPATGGPRMSLAFRLADPAAVDATYQRFLDAGHEGHLPPWDAFWGQRYAVLHDPDGNGVDLFCPL